MISIVASICSCIKWEYDYNRLLEIALELINNNSKLLCIQYYTKWEYDYNHFKK